MPEIQQEGADRGKQPGRGAARWRLLQASLSESGLVGGGQRSPSANLQRGRACGPGAAQLPSGKFACDATTAVQWRLARHVDQAALWAAVSSRCNARSKRKQAVALLIYSWHGMRPLVIQFFASDLVVCVEPSVGKSCERATHTWSLASARADNIESTKRPWPKHANYYISSGRAGTALKRAVGLREAAKRSVM
eukprot:4410488-Pleurochrysis_carterae.AAC.1